MGNRPTLAEFRADLAANVEATPQGVTADVLRSLLHMVDAYEARAAARPQSSQAITRTIREHERAQQLADRERMIREQFPEQQWPMADVLARIAEARAEGEKAKERTPGAIVRAKAEGLSEPAIARLLDVTPSYVYSVLRKHRDDPTSVADAQAELLALMNEYEEETRAARRRTAAEHGVEPDPEDQ